jgi:5-methylcytosine-specific restriction endonuclease McrA
MPYVNKPRPYKKENIYKAKPDQIAKRVQRNAARREMMRAGLVHKGDGKEVDHIKPLSKGGTNSRSNLRVKTAVANRSFARQSNHKPK